MNIFLDSSVMLAFCRSKTGGSALILDYCRHGKLKGYISQKVMQEVEKNIQKKMDQTASIRFKYVLAHAILSILDDPSTEELEKASSITKNTKDSPIFACVKECTSLAFLLSLDKGFFLQRKLLDI